MLPIEAAFAAVMAECRSLPPQRRPLDAALHHVLAETISADRDSPPFDKALVDGYAIRATELSTPGATFAIGEEIPAGRVPSRVLAPGEAALIMTGAPLPAGADAVVMIEQTRREPDGNRVRMIETAARPGQNRMERGQEMRRGDVVLRPATLLTPPRIGLLATVGQVRPLVVPMPRVHILATGDEIVDPAATPGPGQIRNSNAAMLQAFVTRALPGAASDAGQVRSSTAPDQRERLRDALAIGLEADVLLITGGVSAGNRDLVPETLAALGVTTIFHKVRLKPGKPLLFGVGPARSADGRPGCLVFGLPGNPVSAIVGFLIFVKPALDRLRGLDPDSCRRDPFDRPRFPLLAPFTQRGDRVTYHPARLVAGRDGRQAVETLRWSGSADLRALADADGFALFEAGDHDYPGGTPVPWEPLF